LARYRITDATLYPMVRGRLIAVNDRPVQPGDYVAENAQRLVDREFNLSYMDELPGHNRLTAGRWFAPNVAELSLEEGIAKTLALKLGDRLRFDIAGQEVEARVGNLRKVEWDSMRVNFFVIFPTAMLEDMPQSFISAFHLPAGQEALVTELVQTFPNLTVLDTGVILRQVQTLLEQVIQAVEFLFLFTVISGLTVIYAALASSRDERIREAALLRALGASARQLARAQMLEFVLLGALAGLMAALGATVVGWLLASQVFDFAFHFNPAVFAAGVSVGILCATLSGWAGLRDVLNQPPWKTLRET